MSKRRYGLAAAIGLGVTALLGVPQVIAQDAGSEPGPAGGPKGEGVVTYSADEAETNGTRTAAGDSDIEFVALGSGCRVFDSRQPRLNAGGPLINGQSRNYSLKSSDVPSQGGASGGCGIPDSAVAVDLSLSTVANSPTNFGFIRAGQGGATPTATVLQFLKDQGTSVTTTVPMDAAQKIRLVASGANTDVTGDVLGYWEVPLHATVTVGGSLERGSGVVQVARSSFFTGDYTVTFDREVGDCTPVVSLPTDYRGSANATLNTSPGSRKVNVRTRNTSLDGSWRPFRLTVNC